MANISETLQPMSQHLWAVLLAGGDGIRLRDLTFRIVGDNRPKQFCPIVGPQSLLNQTRSRLSPLFASERQVFVVSRPYQSFYEAELADAKQSIVIAQPVNGGTAIGILIALLQVMQSDPDAVIGFFPCDHHYSDEERFRSMVRSSPARSSFPTTSSSSGPRPSVPRLNTGGLNQESRCRKGEQRLFAASTDFGRSRLCQSRANCCGAVASGILSSR